MPKLYECIPQSITGSLTRGGVSAPCLIDGDTDAINKGDNIRIQARSLAGFADNDHRDILNAWALSDPSPIQFGPYTSRANVTIGTSNEMLSGESIQDIGFTFQASPANMHQMNPMTLAHIFYHCMEDHCNHIKTATVVEGIIENTSIDYTGSTDLERYKVTRSDNMWSTLQKIGGGESTGEFYRPWFDRFNTLYYQKSPAFWVTPPASKGTLNKDNIKGTPRIEIRNSKPGDIIGQVQIETVKDYDTVYKATYPAARVAGKVNRTSRGIWSSGQADTTQKAEDLYKWLTRPYTMQVEIDAGLLFFGDDGRGLRLADAVTVVYDGPTENATTGAGLHINLNKKFYIFGYTVRFDLLTDSAIAILTLEADN